MTDQHDIIRTAQIIEALIFASRDPMAERFFEKYIPDGITMQDVLSCIANRYGEDSGVELTQVGQGWAFRTKADIAAMLNVEKDVERPLSRAALETVSIIAYHQPITRSEIEEIRGVSISRGTIDILLELGWIKPKGRRKTPGRPLTWGTTDGFLDHFGLDNITALPGLDELKQAGLLRMGQSISDRNGLTGLFSVNEEEDDDANEDDNKDSDDMVTDFDEDEFQNFDDLPDDNTDNV